MKSYSSKRFWVALAIIISIAFLRFQPIIITFFIIACAIYFSAKTVRPLRNYKFWIVILLLILLVPAFTGLPDKSIIGISYSSEQLQKTLFMAFRGISVFLLFQVLTIDLNIDKIKSLFSRIGVKYFDVLYNLSNEIFPKIKGILIARYSQFKDGWKHKRSLDNVLTLFSDIFVDFFKLTEQLSNIELEKAISPYKLINDISDTPALVVITGDAGSGKTPYLEKLIEILHSQNIQVDGLLSIKVNVSDSIWYHDLKRIYTNETHQLTSMADIGSNISVGKFNFYETCINWGNSELESIQDMEWLVLDEVGILEFNGSGFVPGLQSIINTFSGCLVITIRSSLVDRLTEFIKDYLPSIVSWKKQIINI